MQLNMAIKKKQTKLTKIWKNEQHSTLVPRVSRNLFYILDQLLRKRDAKRMNLVKKKNLNETKM
jgi:hypothetical protein